MAYKTIYKGVIFIEGKDDRVDVRGPIEYKYGLMDSQLMNLEEVKDALAYEAKLRKCNCIINFKYGQKTSLFAFDDNKWYGSGDCGVLSEADYQEIIKNELVK